MQWRIGMTRQVPLVAVLALSSSGCMWLQDFETEQCEKNSACVVGGQGGTFYGVCRNNVCEQLECTDTQDCVGNGEMYSDAVCVAKVCSEAQCTEDADCSEEGSEEQLLCEANQCLPEEDVRWGCADDLPAQGIVDGTMVDVRLRVLRLNGTMGLPVEEGLEVKACQAPDCENAFGPWTDDDADGWVDTKVNRGFQGIYRITAPNSMDTILDVKSPVNEPTEIDQVRLMGLATVTRFGGIALSEPPNLETGGLVLLMFLDCRGDRLPDIRVVAPRDGDATVFYVDGSNFPQNDATATNVAGVAGVINIEQGLKQLNVWRASKDELLRDFSVYVEPTHVTYATIVLGQ